MVRQFLVSIQFTLLNVKSTLQLHETVEKSDQWMIGSKCLKYPTAKF